MSRCPCFRMLFLGPVGEAVCLRNGGHSGPHSFKFSLDENEVEAINTGADSKKQSEPEGR